MRLFSHDDAISMVGGIAHWHHRFEIYPGIETPGSYNPQGLWNKLDIEHRCRTRVLDIGASDGYFSKQIDLLGGDVTAVDYRAKASHGFGVMEVLHGKPFRYEHANLYDLDSNRLGQFDVVLFLGVLYHLPDMMRAFRQLRSLCSGRLMLETHSDNAFCPGIAAARYHKGTSLAGDITNFWSPNTLCVLDMLHDASFDVIRHEAWDDRLFCEAIASGEPGRSYKMDVAYGRL